MTRQIGIVLCQKYRESRSKTLTEKAKKIMSAIFKFFIYTKHEQGQVIKSGPGSRMDENRFDSRLLVL